MVGESVSHARDLSIVYTPLARGRRDLGRRGARDRRVPARSTSWRRNERPTATFPTCPGHVSNPENPRALEAAIAEARATGADLVLASDPDADRIGVGIPVTGDPKGEWTTLDGNQIGVLLAAFVIKETEALGPAPHRSLPGHDPGLHPDGQGTRPPRGDPHRGRPPGRLQVDRRADRSRPGVAGFLFGFEESHGYLKGTYARDKDAAVASLLFAELAATVKDRKQTVLEYLDDLYIDVGHYGERLINKTYKGREGLDKIRSLMKAFRTKPPPDDRRPRRHRGLDYQAHEIRDLARPGNDPPPARALGRHAHLPHRAARHPVRRPSLRHRAQDQVLPLRPHRGEGPRSLAEAKAATARRLDQMSGDIEEYVTRALASPG